MYFNLDEINKMKCNLNRCVTLNRSLKLVGHRGICNDPLYRENTLNVFKKVIISGVDGIEFDIFVTLDGVSVITHDQIISPIRLSAIEECSQSISTEAISPTQSFVAPSVESLSSFWRDSVFLKDDDYWVDVLESTSEQLSKLEIDASGSKVPTLYEIFSLVEEANSIRKSCNFPPLSLHIDFKGAKEMLVETSAKIFESVNYTVKTLINYQKSHGNTTIKFEDIYFCSFNQAALMHLISLFSGDYDNIPKTNFKFAFSVCSKCIFEENKVGEFYRVLSGAEYVEKNMNKLRQVFLFEDAFVAYDFILWDLSRPLIDIATERKKDIFVSATNWQDYENNEEAVVFLLTLSREISTFFKCDDFDKMDQTLLSLQEKQELLDCYESDNQLLAQEDLLFKYKEGYVFIEQEESQARNKLELIPLKSKAFRCNDALAKKPRRNI